MSSNLRQQPVFEKLKSFYEIVFGKNWADNMTELEYVLENFERHFRSYKGQKIILHGTREYAKCILNKFCSDFNFVAIMTNEDLPSDTFCGRPVIQPVDVARVSADLVILTERVKYECTAYESIRKIALASELKVLDMYGVDIEKVYQDYNNIDRPLSEDKRIIFEHDIIIFEMMDTFLVWQNDVLVPEPRSESLYRYAKRIGKTVYFSLRKSFPEKDQSRALIKKQIIIDDNDPALIRRTGEDLSLRILTEKHKGKKAVYFGTGFANEFLLPRYYGMDSYYPKKFVPFFDVLDDIVSTSDSSFRRGKGTYSEIKEIIASFDVISFDIFDTLITRKVLEPRDVLDVMGERLKGFEIENIARLVDERKNVQKEFPDEEIHQFYRIIQTRLGLSDHQRNRLMEMELSIEKELIIRRERVCSLFEFAKECGKTVILTSDMYIPGGLLGDILRDLGITGWDEIIVSCDHHSFKCQELFGIVRKKYPQSRILHLGNDLYADIIPTERYSIRSIHIPSGLDLAKRSGWGKILNVIVNSDERNLFGLIISHIFNDPFTPLDCLMLEQKKRMERFAIGACLPIVLGYLFWLEKTLGKENYDKLLLLSRDGYILTDLYKELRQRSRVHLPEEIYFYSNRHSAFLLCADDEVCKKSVYEILKSGFPYKELFFNFFGFYSECETDDLTVMLEKNDKRINDLVRTQKDNFSKYLRNSGINPAGCYAVMDFVSTGKTIDFISKGTGIEFCGCFFVHRNSVYTPDNKVYSYINKDASGFFIDYYMEMEHIMTSPEPALDRFDEYGNPVFAEEVRSQSDISDILYIQGIIKKTASEYMRHFYHDGITINPLFASESYAADGLHGIMKEAYDDWAKSKLI